MADVTINDFETRVIHVLNTQKEDFYHEVLARLNYEDRKLNLIERVIRIEDELKNQRELIEHILHQMDKRFEQVDKRFESLQREMDSRFEQVDKRFNLLTWMMGIGFTVITSFLVVILNFVLK